MRWPCANDPRAWGAGDGPSRPDVALEGCRVCPRDHDECLTEFAEQNDPQASEGMVVAGLHGRALRMAIRQLRSERRRRVA